MQVHDNLSAFQAIQPVESTPPPLPQLARGAFEPRARLSTEAACRTSNCWGPRVSGALPWRRCLCLEFSPRWRNKPSVTSSRVVALPSTIWPGSGSDVVVTATRGGADSATLRVERGTIGGRETLRFSYPGDRIVYPRMSRGSRTDIRVREDGTFGGPHPWDRDHRQGRARRGESVTIGGSGQGREAYADLVVAVPEGQTFDVYLGVGNIALSNVSGTIGVDASSASVTAEGIRGWDAQSHALELWGTGGRPARSARSFSRGASALGSGLVLGQR